MPLLIDSSPLKIEIGPKDQPANRVIELGACYKTLLHFQDLVLFLDGNKGSGKTFAALVILYLRALMHPGSSWALWRSRRTRLADSVMKTMETEVYPAMGIAFPLGGDRTHRTHYKIIDPATGKWNGSTFIPIGLDDINRSQSQFFAGGYLNEGVELDSEDQVQALIGTLRETTVPYNQLIIDSNPGPPSHFLNHKAEEVPKSIRKLPKTREEYDRIQEWNQTPAVDPVRLWKRVICGHEDNPGYFDVDGWKLKAMGERYVTKTLGGYTGTMKLRYVDRQWAAGEGSVFGQDFDEDRHIIDPFPAGVPSVWPCVLAKDPGRDHPDATILTAVGPMFVVRNDEKLYRLYVVWESVTGKSIGRPSSTEEDARIIDREASPRFRIVRKLGDPHMMFSQTKFHPTGQSIAQQMEEYGHVFEPGPIAVNQKEICEQAEMIRTLLITNHPDDGEPMLQVSRDCPRTIAMFMGLQYERNTAGGITKGDDKIQTLGDDEFDALRQIVASRPKFENANWAME